MQSDSYGQGIPYPTLTDKPNIQTMGSGIVDGLTPQTIMRFPSLSVAAATLTTPSAGMTIYSDDVGRLYVYDGTSWNAIPAGTPVWQNITLASGYNPDGNDNGTPQYRVVDLFGEPTIMLRGGVGLSYPGGSLPNSAVLNATMLPEAARPAKRRTITVASSASAAVVTSVKLDIGTGGQLTIVGTNADNKPPWISLNGSFCSL